MEGNERRQLRFVFDNDDQGFRLGAGGDRGGHDRTAWVLGCDRGLSTNAPTPGRNPWCREKCLKALAVACPFNDVSEKAPLLMLGLPKGSLEESTKTLFAKAGWKITTSSRSYRPSIDDPELDGRFVRAQEVSRYVEHGFFDCGLTGDDWIKENAS